MVNLDKREEIEEFAEQVIDIFGSNIFKNGRVIYRSSDDQYSLVETSDAFGNRSFVFTRTADFRKLEDSNEEMFREKAKVERKVLTSISGLLPQSEVVFCLGAFAEGAMTNSSFTRPEFEGGQLFLLGLRSTNVDFALSSRLIPNVGVPTTLFLVRAQRVLAAQEYISSIEDNNFEMLEIKSVYTVCVKSKGRIDEDTEVFNFPFTNTSVSSFGHVCLGQNRGKDILRFKKATHLDTFPVQFFDSMASTHEYSPGYASRGKITLSNFLESLQDKPFPNDELVKSGMTLGEWLAGVFNHMYR